MGSQKGTGIAMAVEGALFIGNIRTYTGKAILNGPLQETFLKGG